MRSHRSLVGLLALIFVPPLTDFSKDPDMVDGDVGAWSAGLAIYWEIADLAGGIGRLWDIPPKLLREPRYWGHAVFAVKVFAGPECTPSGIYKKRTFLAVGRLFRHRALSPKFA